MGILQMRRMHTESSFRLTLSKVMLLVVLLGMVVAVTRRGSFHCSSSRMRCATLPLSSGLPPLGVLGPLALRGVSGGHCMYSFPPLQSVK